MSGGERVALGEIFCVFLFFAGLMIVLHALRLRGCAWQLAWIGYGMLVVVALYLIGMRLSSVLGWL